MRRHDSFIPAGQYLKRCVLIFDNPERTINLEASVPSASPTFESETLTKSNVRSTSQHEAENISNQTSIDDPSLPTDDAKSINWLFAPPPLGVDREPTVCQSFSERESESSDASTINCGQPSNIGRQIMNLPFRLSNPSQPPAGVAKKPRNPHHRTDGLTEVCGVFSPGRNGTPLRTSSKVANANYYCPRCESSMTRPRSIKDHFLVCIGKYGNPDKLKYTDHASMATVELRRQRNLASMGNGGHARGGVEMMSDEDGDSRMEGWVDEQ